MNTKYEVRTFYIETKDGTDAFEKWNDSTCQETTLIGSFNTKEEAQAAYENVDTYCEKVGQVWLHKCKCIEVNEYDNEGEWIGGGDWLIFNIPDGNRE